MMATKFFFLGSGVRIIPEFDLVLIKGFGIAGVKADSSVPSLISIGNFVGQKVFLSKPSTRLNLSPFRINE